jgi:hypothetical protein
MLPPMAIKKQKSHTSTRKKSSASAAASPRTKKAASKASKRVGKSKASKTKERPAWLKKRDELTLKMFQEIYEDYQQGKFHRIL